MAKYCCICKKELEKEDAPILIMGGYGNPKCICDDCEKLIETATTSRDYEEINSTCMDLRNSLTAGNTGDEKVIESVNEIITSASERGEAIKNGTYDFELDSVLPSEEEFEITEELEETEEDRKKDERDEKIGKIIDTVTSWIAGIALVGALVFFIIKFVL